MITIPLIPVVIAASVLSLVFFTSLPLVTRRTDLSSITREHLRRFAPLYFVAGPSAITYFAVCGTVSVIATFIFLIAHAVIANDNATCESITPHEIFTMYRWIEYTCSFLGAYVFARLIRWVGLSWIWMVITVVSLAVSAAYRTARQESGPNASTGPDILLSPQWLDAIPVILGLGLFLLHRALIIRRSI
jgi:hypothetical protein